MQQLAESILNIKKGYKNANFSKFCIKHNELFNINKTTEQKKKQ